MGAIGAGVSGTIVREWPKVGEEYMYMCMTVENPLQLFGHWYAVQVSARLTVYNIFSQYHYGNAAKTGRVYTDMDKLEHALRHIAAAHETVYVPYGIGCGLAGGNWNELCSRLEDVNNIVAVRK